MLAAPTIIQLCFTLLTIIRRGTTITTAVTTTSMSKQRKTSSLASTDDANNGERDIVADTDLSEESAVNGSSPGEDPKLSDPIMMIPRVLKHRRSRSTTATNRATIPLRSPIELSTTVLRSTDATAGADSSTFPPKKEARTTETRQTRASLSFAIRPLRMKDIALVYHLGNNIFTASEFPNMYRTWDDFTVVENFEGSPEFCFVAESTSSSSASSSKEIIGFLLGQTMTKSIVGTRGYIQWVAVTNAYRRHGVATRLLQSFANVAKDENVSFLLADTPADNLPAICMFQKAGLCSKTDHVYLTRQMPKETKLTHVSEDGTFSFTYSANKKRITIRNMEIDDLYPIYLIGEQIFTTKSSNLYNFWDEHLVLQSFLSDPEYCVVATVKEQDKETVVGFCFGTTIEKPRSSWKYAYLVWLGCSNDYQGLGLASQLYNVMLELFWRK
jgi:ribosomal protein S18 acetylase RimI-like enzyme